MFCFRYSELVREVFTSGSGSGSGAPTTKPGASSKGSKAGARRTKSARVIAADDDDDGEVIGEDNDKIGTKSPAVGWHEPSPASGAGKGSDGGSGKRKGRGSKDDRDAPQVPLDPEARFKQIRAKAEAVKGNHGALPRARAGTDYDAVYGGEVLGDGDDGDDVGVSKLVRHSSESKLNAEPRQRGSRASPAPSGDDDAPRRDSRASSRQHDVKLPPVVQSELPPVGREKKGSFTRSSVPSYSLQPSASGEFGDGAATGWGIDDNDAGDDDLM